jgi:bacteriocin-like protein
MSNDAATSEQVREPSRELAEDELAQVTGGIIAVLIGLFVSRRAKRTPFSG